MSNDQCRSTVGARVLQCCERQWRHLFLDVPNTIAPNHVRFCLFLNYISIFSIIAHLLFVPLFVHLQVRPLAYYNILSIFILGTAWLINRKGGHYISMSLMVVEFAVHALLAVRMVGWQFGFQYFIIGWSWVPFMAPSGKWLVKAGVLVAACGWFVYLTRYAAIPVFPVGAWQLTEAPIINAANLGFFCTAFAGCFLTFRNLVDSAEDEASRAHAVSEHLLHNILPVKIADRLKQKPDVIADAYDAVSVLFLDIVNYTVLSERMTPAELVSLLDAIFSRLDSLAAQYNIEKIKTIGDAYMVAAGVPTPQANHAEVIGLFAIEALDLINGFSADGKPLMARIGIDTGPVVAGVIGQHKFIYDLWGDTVNTASRMESHGVPHRIHTSRRYYDQTRQIFSFEKRGMIEIKGKGTMETFFLVGIMCPHTSTT